VGAVLKGWEIDN